MMNILHESTERLEFSGDRILIIEKVFGIDYIDNGGQQYGGYQNPDGYQGLTEEELFPGSTTTASSQEPLQVN